MKRNFILMLAVLPLVFSGCSKGDDPKDEELDINKFKGTKWTAVDDIAELIYGKTCTTSIEFISDNECQQIDIRDTKNFAGTDVEKGTYTFKGDSVFWTIDNHTIAGEATGSVLTTDMGTISGGKRIYTKQ